MDEKEVIAILQNYTYYATRLQEITKELESITYKVTPTYGNLAPSSGGGNDSKVETTGNRRLELRKKALYYKHKVQAIDRMIERSGLTEKEKGVMWWIAKNGRLAAYARREHIGKDNVYKIRDRAVNKIIAAAEPQNVI